MASTFPLNSFTWPGLQGSKQMQTSKMLVIATAAASAGGWGVEREAAAAATPQLVQRQGRAEALDAHAALSIRQKSGRRACWVGIRWRMPHRSWFNARAARRPLIPMSRVAWTEFSQGANWRLNQRREGDTQHGG